MLDVVLALVVSAAPAEGPGVALLPLVADDTVGDKEARGVDALLRAAVDDGGFARLLPTRKDDAKTAKGCALDDACLRDAAFARGVDLLAGGRISGNADGYLVELRVVAVDDGVEARTVSRQLDGGALRDGVDRLARLAFRPDTLRGALVIDGSPEGALVLVDGERVGKLPLDGPVADLVEGEHKVEVRAPGYDPITRPVNVVHQETTPVSIVLSKEGLDLDTPLEADAREPSPLDPILAAGPWVVLGAGAVLIGAGVVAGVFSLLDRMEVERRAEAKLLVFPRDALLVRRGFALAITADVLYAAGAVLVVAGGTWAGLSFLLGGEEE